MLIFQTIYPILLERNLYWQCTELNSQKQELWTIVTLTPNETTRHDGVSRGKIVAKLRKRVRLSLNKKLSFTIPSTRSNNLSGTLKKFDTELVIYWSNNWCGRQTLIWYDYRNFVMLNLFQWLFTRYSNSFEKFDRNLLFA